MSTQKFQKGDKIVVVKIEEFDFGNGIKKGDKGEVSYSDGKLVWVKMDSSKNLLESDEDEYYQELDHRLCYHEDQLELDQERNMGKFKDIGNPALALVEEMAEATQVIMKKYRFENNWYETIPGKDHTPREALMAEMEDVLYQWERLKKLLKILDKV